MATEGNVRLRQRITQMLKQRGAMFLAVSVKSIPLFAAIGADVEPILKEPVVHPQGELGILNALAALGIECSPIKVPSPALAPIVLCETSKEAEAGFHDGLDLRSQAFGHLAKDALERLFDLRLELTLVGLVVLVGGVGVNAFEKLKRRGGEGVHIHRGFVDL